MPAPTGRPSRPRSTRAAPSPIRSAPRRKSSTRATATIPTRSPSPSASPRSKARRPRSSSGAAWAPWRWRISLSCGPGVTCSRARGSTAAGPGRSPRRLGAWGQALDPLAAWLIDRGMRTLAVRVERHNQNGLRVAQWCATQPAFGAVHYPGLPTHPDYDTAQRVLTGYGGMLAVELKGGARGAERFLRALKIAAHAPSLGAVPTLGSGPRLTSHASLTPAERARAGIPDGLLRFSLGLEDADDIIADFKQALAPL